MAVEEGSASRESGKDKRIFLRVFGSDKIYWYVIEDKSLAIDVEDNNTTVMIGCASDNDRVRRLSFLCTDMDKYEEASLSSSNVAVINSTVYLIGGSIQKKNEGACSFNGECIAYRRFDLDSGVGEWQPDGGNLVRYQGGGAAVGPDGNIYTVGYEIYRLSPLGNFCEEFVSPPIFDITYPIRYPITLPRLLAVTRKKLFIYTIEGGMEGANLILSYDLESKKWDILDDNNSYGDWSAGVVLYDDKYLFSFCSQNPTGEEEVDVAGVYVFDIERCVWLAEPVEGLPADGKVLPIIYTPDPAHPDVFVETRLSPFLLQVGTQDEHKLALLWDGHGTHPETLGPQVKLVWSKFVVNCRTSSAADQCPHFYADSVSSGLCPLDDCTFDLINCAAGM